MRTLPTARPRSAFLRPAVLAPIVVLVLAGLGWAVAAWLAAGDAAAARARLLADVEAATTKEPVDAGELSRLTALLQELPDHATARDVLAAQARVELARDRPERAEALFLAQATQPGALPAEQGIGAHILLRQFEAGAGDPAAASSMLTRALTLAEAAYAESRSPADLLRAWQAALRLGQKDRERALAEALARDHGDSKEAQFVAFVGRFDGSTTPAGVEAAIAAFPGAPVEARALLAAARLASGDVPGAVAASEAALARAPGLFDVRWMAAVAFHACVAGSPAGSDARASWVARRDAQLDWVARQPGIDDARRAQIAELRGVR